MTVKIKIKVYGTLMKCLPGYDHHSGIDLELPEGTRVDALIDRLKIPKSRISLVSINEHLAKGTDCLSANALVKLFPSIFGG
jgi:sulfur carrier protein ThiS